MRLEWSLFRKNITVPKELKRINAESKGSEFSVGQLEMMQKIASFIGVDNWSSGVVRCAITPVSGTKRFREMVKAFGNDNMEINRQSQQVTKTTRKVSTTYKLLVNFDDHIFRVEVETQVTVTFNAGYMISIYDNQLQEMCNITCLGYLKASYPYLYKLFIQCVEIPTLDILEKQIKERFKYCMERVTTYRLNGFFLIPVSNDKVVDLNTVPGSTTIAELLEMKRVNAM